MKTLVIYGSAYGNTAQVAKTLAERLKAKARLAEDVTPKDVGEADLVVVGSPTQGGRPTQACKLIYTIRCLVYWRANP